MGSRRLRLMNMSNFVKIGHLVAKILTFFNFSRWRPLPSWIVEFAKFYWLTVSGTNLLFASAFDNRLADRKSAFKRFNGNNQATSCPNLVNFRPVISEFTLLKRAMFASIRPQFDEDLHSSRWRFQMDWKITILISGE